MIEIAEAQHAANGGDHITFVNAQSGAGGEAKAEIAVAVAINDTM